MGGTKPKNSMLEPVLITDPGGIAAIEDEWRALAELRSNGFVTPEWLRAWWDHQGHLASSLLIVAVRRDDGSLAGVMPLALDASSRPRAIRFAGAALGDRFHPAARREDEAAVAASSMAALQANGVARHMLLFEHIESEQPWLSKLRAASPRRLAMTEQQQTELPYISLAGLDWEGYLQSRSSSFRKKLRQRDRKLQQGHEVAVRSATDATLDADLAHYFALHERRFQSKSTILSPSAREFLSAFATAAQRRGWLRLHLLEVDGLPVAAFLGWRVGDTYAFYNSGFDPEWSDLSVGMVLLTRIVQSAIEEGAAEFDMLLGNEAYKRRFTSEARPGLNVVLTPAMRPMSLLVAGEARARRLAKRLDERPARGMPARGIVARSLRLFLPTARAL